jgi:hypothetical protein
MGDINTKTCPTRLGIELWRSCSVKKKIVEKFKEVKIRRSTLAEYSKERYGSKRAVLPIMMIFSTCHVTVKLF